MQIFKTREEWLKARRGTIGGSDAGAVIGVSPFRSSWEAWQDMTGQAQRREPTQEAWDRMRYGLQAEAPLRELFKLDFPEYNFQYYENNLWTNDLFPWAHASLDGWMYDQAGRMGVWECKTATIKTEDDLISQWRGHIPDIYYKQILHQMAVTGADFAVEKAHRKLTYLHTTAILTRHYFYEREDNKALIYTLMQLEKEFHRCMQDPAQGPPVWVKTPEETEAEA
jgi:putative phage-type endonuclease